MSAFPTTLTPSDNPFTFALLGSWDPERSPRGLPGMTVSQFLRGLPVERDRYDDELPLVAIIDQFEDVFSDVPHWEALRGPFLDELAEAVQDIARLHLVLSLREDLVGNLLPYESRLSRHHRARLRLRGLGPDAALAAVTGPLEGTSRSFAPGVAEGLVERLRTTTLTNAVGETRVVEEREVEPVKLQIVCSSLWDSLPDEVTTITPEHLEDHGDVDAALTRFCTEAVAEVAAAEGIATSVLWDWLARTFITDLGTRGTAYEGIADTGGMPNTVARAFEERRILQPANRSGSVWFELQSDGLIAPIQNGQRAASRAPEPSEPDGGTRPDGYLRMAETALADGMLSRAEEYARNAAQAAQDQPRTIAEAESFLAKLALDEARMTEASEQADELYSTAERHFQAATALFELERDSSAVGRLLLALGRLFAERGRYPDAVEMIQSALVRLPGDVRAQMELAHVLSAAGQPHAAIGAYSAVLVTAPDTTEALLGRAQLAAEHSDPATALADLNDAIRLRPEVAGRPDVLAIRARALARVEREG